MSKKDDPWGNIDYLRDWIVIVLQKKIMENPGKYTADKISVELRALINDIDNICEYNRIAELHPKLTEKFGEALLKLIFLMAICKVDSRVAISTALEKIRQIAGSTEEIP
jgi:hypothetical protein